MMVWCWAARGFVLKKSVIADSFYKVNFIFLFTLKVGEEE